MARAHLPPQSITFPKNVICDTFREWRGGSGDAKAMGKRGCRRRNHATCRKSFLGSGQQKIDSKCAVIQKNAVTLHPSGEKSPITAIRKQYASLPTGIWTIPINRSELKISSCMMILYELGCPLGLAVVRRHRVWVRFSCSV